MHCRRSRGLGDHLSRDPGVHWRCLLLGSPRPERRSVNPDPFMGSGLAHAFSDLDPGAPLQRLHVPAPRCSGRSIFSSRMELTGSGLSSTSRSLVLPIWTSTRGLLSMLRGLFRFLAESAFLSRQKLLRQDAPAQENSLQPCSTQSDGGRTRGEGPLWTLYGRLPTLRPGTSLWSRLWIARPSPRRPWICSEQTMDREFVESSRCYPESN